MNRKRVAILISGRGSNMAALIAAAAAPDFPAEIVLVLSDKPDAAGLETARSAGVSVEAVDRKGFADKTAFEAAITQQLEAADVDLICLAGFMRILSSGFVSHWLDRIINIHPSILPAFRGIDTHRRALEAGVKVHGCTVHFVRPEVDDGPIIAQGVIPVLADDTEDSLAERLLAVEHRIFPMALRLVASGAARIEGARVVIEESDNPAAAPMIVPDPAAGK